MDIYNTEDNHLDVRKRICKTIKEHPHFYQNILVDGVTFDKFIKYHATPGNYANHECVMAACDTYNINIIIYELTK